MLKLRSAGITIDKLTDEQKRHFPPPGKWEHDQASCCRHRRIRFDRDALRQAENVLGGSALHFTNAASFFADVGIVAAVGKDFKLGDIEFLVAGTSICRALPLTRAGRSGGRK